jgi:hypothetical protein
MKQYAASPTIQQLIADRGTYFPNSWQDQFYSNIWNVDTAGTLGLDIWGRIVVIGRNIQIPVVDYFGFTTIPTQSWGAFGEESFYTGPTTSTTFRLENDAYRILILAKALSNIAKTDARSLNRVLQQLFPGRGRAWVSDLGSMAMRFYFEFALEPWEMAVLVSGGVLPRPAGVGAMIAQIPAETFGFFEAGADSEPFNQGTLLSNGAVANAN